MLSRCADIRYYLTRDAFRCSLLDFVDPDIGVTRKYGWSIMIQVERDIRSLIISLVQNSTIIFVSEKKKKKKSTYIIYIYIYVWIQNKIQESRYSCVQCEQPIPNHVSL